MERMLGGGHVADEDLPEPAHVVKARKELPKPLLEKFQPWITQAKRYTLPAATFGSALLAGLLMSTWLGRRARYRFPEFDVEPRLGGAHAAGVGAVISFASAAVPPASQRDQVPDYLRRA
jgi:hypothetical protein